MLALFVLLFVGKILTRPEVVLQKFVGIERMRGKTHSPGHSPIRYPVTFEPNVGWVEASRRKPANAGDSCGKSLLQKFD
jgi:hypothetical protein